eukprot:9084849-Pyramimonas_sp.AAC.1
MARSNLDRKPPITLPPPQKHPSKVAIASQFATAPGMARQTMDLRRSPTMLPPQAALEYGN